MFVAYAYFFSNDFNMAIASPSVGFNKINGGTEMVMYNATQPDSTYRYWVAACFDGNMNVRPINRAV